MESEEISDLMMALWQRWRSASPVRRGAITREQYWVLRLLMDGGRMKIKDLASAIGCTAGSASVAVKRLEKAGLVSRERSEKDERVVTVDLAKQGVKTLDAWKGEQLASMGALFEHLSPDERKILHRLLEKALEGGGGIRAPAPEIARGGRTG